VTLAPLLAASPVIQVHAFAALSALTLSVPQLLLRKGGSRHRALGYAWAVAMVVTATTSFFIHTIRMFGPFSWIHLLSGVTLVIVPLAVMRARQRKVTAHATGMRTLVALALVVTGLFTLLPGRIMHDVVWGESPAGGSGPSNKPL
jgi:uncharacterized membrane protein